MKDVHIRIIRFSTNSRYYSIQYKRVGWFKCWWTIRFTDSHGIGSSTLYDEYEPTKQLASTLKTYADVLKLIEDQSKPPIVENIQ